MTWVRRIDDEPHRCDAPRGRFNSPEGQEGDLWRCDECRTLWRIDLACDLCRRYGEWPHRGMHTTGLAWTYASLWQRLIYRNAGRPGRQPTEKENP